MSKFKRDFAEGFLVTILMGLIVLSFWHYNLVPFTHAQAKKLPEGQTCSNTFDTDEAHKCSCLTGMKCPMEKPKPCDDEEGNCDPPEHGPDSTKCISPYCKKEACKCANPCRS